MSSLRAWELGALALALAVWSFVGWDTALWDGRLQLVLHLVAVVAIGGLALLALRGVEMPRTRVDVPILVLLLAFGLASLSAWNAGLSARALAAVVTTAAMLPVALLALRHRPGWTALVVTLPIIALSTGALAVLAWRRIEWVLVGAPGLPPVRMAHEGTPFGSVAVPPFVILAALPLAMVIPGRRLRRAVLASLAGLGVPLTLISGSRSAWIAIVVAALVLGGPWAVRRARSIRPLRLTWRRAAVAAMVASVAVAVAAYLAPRLGAASSLVYRENLWRDTIAAWRPDPLLGIGPGAMPWARQAAAADFSFPVNQPHSHNVLLGILGDTGIVGVVAALVLALAFARVAGPWRQRTLPGRVASAVLAGLAAGMMFEDLTFLPNFNLEVAMLAALALSGAGAVRWQALVVIPRRRLAVGIPALLGAAALAMLMLVGDASRIAYGAGIDAAEHDHWHAATTWLQRSVALDPWHPAGPSSLAVAADFDGRHDEALAAARRAVALNPGDSLSWTNVAVLCRQVDDRACARHAADRAVATARFAGPALVNAAVVYAWLDDMAAADAAYGRSLATNRWTAVTVPWPRPVAPDRSAASELDPSVAELNDLVARGWQGLAIDPVAYATPEARLLAEAMTGEREGALAVAHELESSRTASTTAWQLLALVRSHYGLDVEHELAVAEVANGGPLPSGAGRMPASVTDIASFRSYPADGMVSQATRLLPDEAWPWVLEPLLPAVSPPAGDGG